MEILERILVIIAGVALTAIIAGAGYFFKRLMNSTDSLTSSVSDLKTSITGMNGIILANEGKLDSLKNEHCKDQKVNERRLNKHGDRLDEHDKDLSTLKEKTKHI